MKEEFPEPIESHSIAVFQTEEFTMSRSFLAPTQVSLVELP